MQGGTRVPELAGIELESDAAPCDRASPLELLDGQVHAPPQQRLEGALDAFAADQPLDVAVLAPGDLEQPAVGMPRGPGEDVPDQGEEVGSPALEALPEDRARLGDGEGTPEKRGDLAEVAQPGQGFVEQEDGRALGSAGSPAE
jgi:hypothetical protein